MHVDHDGGDLREADEGLSELEALLEAREPSLAEHARALHEHGVSAATLHSIKEEVIKSILTWLQHHNLSFPCSFGKP